MKQTFFTLLTFFFCTAAIAQEHEEKFTTDSTAHDEHKHDGHKKHEHVLYRSDVSIHLSARLANKPGRYSVKAWAVHQASNRVVIDVHTGFHNKNTVDASVGYNVFKQQDLWFAPKLSIVAGEYMGFAPGILFRMERKNWYIFSELQYLVTPFENPHMIFNFMEIGYAPHPVLEIGFISELKFQMYHKDIAYTSSKLWYDVGPVVRFNVKSIYAEAWWSVDPMEMAEHHSSLHETSVLTLAVGWKFNRCR